MKRIMIVMILIFFQSCLHRDIKNNITELLNKKIIIPENLEAIKGAFYSLFTRVFQQYDSSRLLRFS